MVIAAAGATMADLDREALEQFRVAANIDAPSIRHTDFPLKLAQMGLLTLAPDKRTYVPTKAGVLLFGKQARHFYPHFLVKASFEYGPGIDPATKDFDGPLVLFPAELDEWLGDTLPSTQMRNKVVREDFAKLTTPWIREAVMNAVIHRDYDNENAKVTVVISQEAISVTSPGMPLEQVGIDRLNGFRASSLSVNPLIHFALNKMRAAEERGLGMKTLEHIEASGFPRPSYTTEDPYLCLTIPLTAKAAVAAQLLVLNPDTTGHLSEEERVGLAFLIRNPKASNAQYGAATGLSVRTAIDRQLRKFEDERLIERTGPPRDRTITVTARARR
jgi:ATP-dependent DNA helicase RecG